MMHIMVWITTVLIIFCLFFFNITFIYLSFSVLGYTVSVSVGQALIAELITDVVLYYV